MNVERFFADNGIDLPAVVAELSDKLPNAMFCNNKTEIWKITIPSATDTEPYALFRMPDTVNVRQMLNLHESKTDTADVLFGEIITAELVTGEELKTVELKDKAFCRHGDNYLVQRSSLPEVLYMKLVTTRRIAESMMDDVRLAIFNIYYGLYTRNASQTYESMSILSDSVANHLASNQRVLPLMVNDIEDEDSYLL